MRYIVQSHVRKLETLVNLFGRVPVIMIVIPVQFRFLLFSLRRNYAYYNLYSIDYGYIFFINLIFD